MRKAIISMLAAGILLSHSVTTVSAAAGFDNFRSSGNFTTGQFRDVGGADWFAGYVKSAYNHGLVRGRGDGLFAPGGWLTLGEAVTLAVRMRHIYYTGSSDVTAAAGRAFYTAYADYALDNGIITAHGDYRMPATRAQFAKLIYNALPDEVFSEINEIADGGITDVVSDSSFTQAVYALYRAGILAGADKYGTFFPNAHITRAEAAAIMVRTIAPAERVNVSLPAQISAETIFERSAGAIFMLEMFDALGRITRIGSGFFISSTGLAVTNLHVVEFADNAIATLNNGKSFPVLGVSAHCRINNLAIISIGVDAVSYLNLADSDRVETGDTIFNIGSPQGLVNSITEGIISNTSREIDGSIYFQFTAAISFGSGGSPVFNRLGQVIGVASSSLTDGQNLNLAVPGNLIRALEVSDYYIALGDLHRMS